MDVWMANEWVGTWVDGKVGVRRHKNQIFFLILEVGLEREPHVLIYFPNFPQRSLCTKAWSWKLNPDLPMWVADIQHQLPPRVQVNRMMQQVPELGLRPKALQNRVWEYQFTASLLGQIPGPGSN